MNRQRDEEIADLLSALSVDITPRKIFILYIGIFFSFAKSHSYKKLPMLVATSSVGDL
jgi:hypothetical protein